MAMETTQKTVVRFSGRADRRSVGSRQSTLSRNSGSPRATRRTNHMPKGTTQ